jgi:transcriptional regulator with PAS, ATPase and Fis domain
VAASANILIQGENGTGKADRQRHHYNSKRLKGPFIKINCAAIPGTDRIEAQPQENATART